MDKVHWDAYLSQETEFSFDECMYIVTWNVWLNIKAYIYSVFFGYGAFNDLIVNMGIIGETTAATWCMSGDFFRFLKLTFFHGLLEDLSTILNAFASMILVYFIISYFLSLIKKSGISLSEKLKYSWHVNKIHLKQSLAVFIIGLIVMVMAGVCEVYISVPIGNFIASL